MSIIIEGARGVYFASATSIVEEGKELAWEGASDLMHLRPEVAYLMGRYIETDRANQNGHIFDLDDVRKKIGSIVHTSLNMGHRERYIVGGYLAAELIYPVGQSAAAGDMNAYVESLSTFYRSIFSDEWRAVRAAHDEGSLFQSMECIPESLTCAGVDGCGGTFPYRGVQHDSYCDHLNEPLADKRLNVPNFQGGGIIIPPMRPGWRRADITELASYQRADAATMARLVADNVDQAENVYDQIVREAPDLQAAVWEAVLLDLMDAAYPEGSWTPKKKPKSKPEVDEANLTGGMVCLYPDNADAIAALIEPFEGAEPADQLHLTLAYVAEDAAALSDEVRDAILRSAAAGAQVRADALELTAIGYGLFGGADPQATVLFLQADDAATGAGATAQAVRSVLEAFGAEHFPDAHDAFIPHMTLGYGLDPAAAAPFVGATFRFSAGVTAQLGPERHDWTWGHTPATAPTAAATPIVETVPIVDEAVTPAPKRRRLKVIRNEAGLVEAVEEEDE